MLLALVLTAAPVPCLAMKPEPCLVACEKGDSTSCLALQSLVEDGLLPSTHFPRLFAAVHALCENRKKEQCFAEAMLHLAGVGTPRDPAKAAQLFSDGCDADNPASCTNLAVRYWKGDGVKKDEATARRLALHACEQEPMACLNASWAIGAGIGGAPDAKAAIALLEKTCVTWPGACGRLANDLLSDVWTRRDPERAMNVAKGGCARSDGHSCELVGKMFAGAGSTEDWPAALAWFEKACALGRPVSCFNASRLLTDEAAGKPNLVRSAELAMVACDLGSTSGCHSSAIKLVEGQGTKKNPAAARALFSRTCDAGGMKSCFALGGMLLKGVGGKADKPGALTLFKKACAGGFDDGCTAERQVDR